MTALLIVAWLAAPDIRVAVTPDQPLPFAYVDEPLIVEISSPTEKEAVVQVEIDGHGGPAGFLDLGTVSLAENGAHWRPLEDVARQRGDYVARFTIAAGGITLRQERAFCRIDRPIPDYAFPLSAAADGAAPENLCLAVSAIPGRAIRFEAGTPDLDARLDKVRDSGLQVVMGIPLARVAQPTAEAERLAGLLGDRVVRWEIEGSETPADAVAVIEAIRRVQPRAGIALVVREPAELARLIEAGAAKHAATLVLAEATPEPGGLLALRAEAERAGYEGMSLVALSRGVERGRVDQGQWLVKQVLLNLSVGAESSLDSDLILGAQGLGAAYVTLCGTAHRLKDGAYVGELDLDPGVRTQVFRMPDRWLLVLWAKNDAQDIALKLPQASGLALTDVRNNPLDLPSTTGDVLTLHVGPEPLYLSGTGGTVLADAARRAAAEEAAALLEVRDAKRLPIELTDLLRTMAEAGGGVVDRRGFLALLGMFQVLEQRSQAGELPRETVVPASAGLARLMRHLCVAEHERGEPFLEPFQEMLTKCSEYTGKYLTGATNGAGYRREEWLLGEVGRLLAEAKQLLEAGRSTEADAVAALAEGRARALQYAGEPPGE